MDADGDRVDGPVEYTPANFVRHELDTPPACASAKTRGLYAKAALIELGVVFAAPWATNTLSSQQAGGADKVFAVAVLIGAVKVSLEVWGEAFRAGAEDEYRNGLYRDIEARDPGTPPGKEERRKDKKGNKKKKKRAAERSARRVEFAVLDRVQKGAETSFRKSQYR